MSSFVNKAKITFDRGITIAAVTLDIRLEDLLLIKQYGPALVDFGGTIDYTIDYAVALAANLTPVLPDPTPATVDLEFVKSSDTRSLVDDLKVEYKFSCPTVEIGNIVANAWYDKTILAIQEEIARIRLIDPGTVASESSVVV